MTQVLTVAAVQRKARQYYRARKLMAQHPVSERRECYYAEGSYRCAIGAALTKDTIAEISEQFLNRGNRVESLRAHKIVEVTPEDLAVLHIIQSAHDQWCDSARTFGGRDPGTRAARASFLQKIGIKP